MKIAQTMALCSVEEVTELYNQVLKLNEPVVVELGSYCGYSSYVLAQAVKERNGHLYCIDAFIPGFDGQPHTGEAALLSWKNTMSEYRDVAELHPISTHVASLAFEKDDVDFLFIDADHSYEGLKLDLENWLPKLKSNGIVVLHDFNNKSFPGIEQAFREYTNNSWEEINNVWSMRIFRKP